MSALSFRFRTAVEADLDRLVEIHMSAYPDPRGALERRKNFVANPRGELGALHVVEDGDEIVGHAFLFSLRGWFAGGTVALGAVASVAVAPEARGRGIAAALLTHLHERADAAKASVTMLYAFRQGFYAKHGYASVTPNRRLQLHPASIPPEWRNEPGVTLRAVRADPSAPAADRTAIVNAYARAAGRAHGWLVRPVPLWEHYFANERRVWILATQGRRVSGYVCWSLTQSEAHAITRLVVHELVADDAATRRALLGAVGAQRDQVGEVELETDAHDPLDRALLDADRTRFGSSEVEHVLGAVTGGPMVRLVDVTRGLTARAYLDDGAIDLLIDGRPPFTSPCTEGKSQALRPAPGARAPRDRSRRACRGSLRGPVGQRRGSAPVGRAEKKPRSRARTPSSRRHRSSRSTPTDAPG